MKHSLFMLFHIIIIYFYPNIIIAFLIHPHKSLLILFLLIVFLFLHSTLFLVCLSLFIIFSFQFEEFLVLCYIFFQVKKFTFSNRPLVLNYSKFWISFSTLLICFQDFMIITIFWILFHLTLFLFIDNHYFLL